MSILVADVMMKTAFEISREAVFSAQDIRGEEIFVGVDTKSLTDDECKQIVRLICAPISKVEERSWSSSTASGCCYMGKHVSTSLTFRKMSILDH